MYGAIIGDVVGWTYEFAGKKEKKFPLFPGGSDFTGDSILEFDQFGRNREIAYAEKEIVKPVIINVSQ